MADKPGTTIIIKKKKKGGGHGHHGGAWKVAYADFVTAMMAFFLVMWLMGADESTKAKVVNYFVNPNTPYVEGQNPASGVDAQVGSQSISAGNRILNGLDGQNPQDLIPDPTRPQRSITQNKELAQRAQELLDDNIFGLDLTVEYLRFSIPADVLFENQSIEFLKTGKEYLNKLGDLISSFDGFVTITTHTDGSAEHVPQNHSPYEFSLSRSVSVMRHFIRNNWIAEERVKPRGGGTHEPFTDGESEASQRLNRRVEFILSQKEEKKEKRKH